MNKKSIFLKRQKILFWGVRKNTTFFKSLRRKSRFSPPDLRPYWKHWPFYRVSLCRQTIRTGTLGCSKIGRTRPPPGCEISDFRFSGLGTGYTADSRRPPPRSRQSSRIARESAALGFWARFWVRAPKRTTRRFRIELTKLNFQFIL